MFRVVFFYSPEFPWVKCSLTQLSGSLHLQLWMGMAHLRSGFPGDVPVPCCRDALQPLGKGWLEACPGNGCTKMSNGQQKEHVFEKFLATLA